MRRKSERNSSSSTTSRRSSRRKQTEGNVDDEGHQLQQQQEQSQEEGGQTSAAIAEYNNDDEQSEKVSENEKSETGVEVITKRTKTSTQQPDSSSDREESDADVLSTRRTPSKRARTPGKARQSTRRTRGEKIQTIEEENGNEKEIESKDQIISETENNQQLEAETKISPKEIIQIDTEIVPIINSETNVESKDETNKEIEAKPQEIETPVDQNSELESNKDEQKRRSRKISNSSPTKKHNEEEPKEIKKPPRKSRFDERPKDLQAEIEQNKISEELQMEKSKNIAKTIPDQQCEKPIEQIAETEIAKEQIVVENVNHKKKIENVLEKPQRKRKWLSRKPSAEHVLAITTDSLKELISDVVHPVPLSDVKLDSSPEHEEVSIVIDEKTLAVVNCDEDNDPDGKINNNSSHDLLSPKQRQHSKDRSVNAYRRSNSRDRSVERNSREKKGSISTNRKISIVDKQKPPSPSRNISSSILYITNLVRPFTVLQLKGLLARTGKIVEENGFWIDRIKSKCFVRYETEDEAIETRHALHGVRWPTSNPKCLNVDFGTDIAMEKAIASTLDEQPKINRDSVKENRIMGTGWDKDRLDFDREKREVQIRPVREWDVGKKDDFDRDAERNRTRNDRNGGRNNERDKDQLIDRSGRDDRRDRERDREQHERGRRQSSDRENHRRRSESGSPVRKYRKKENEPPLRLLDDLFRKTKTTPCVYWLPLTPEQIAEKEQARQKRIEEREKIRQEREREREKERRDKRSRSRNKRY